MVDCAQMAAHRAIDVGPIGAPLHPDFVALSGHKAHAPFGTGALTSPREFSDQGQPEYSGGGTIDLVSLDKVYGAQVPERDAVGSPNLLGAVALAAGIRVLTFVGLDAIAHHEMELTGYALQQMSRLPELTLYGSRDPNRPADRLGVIPLQLKGVPHALTSAVLGFEGGIAVRDGCFCAHPNVIRLLQVDEHEFEQHKRLILSHDKSQTPGLVRVSLGCYNNQADIDHLIEMLGRMIAGDYQGDYRVDKRTGFYWPRQFDPQLLQDCYAI